MIAILVAVTVVVVLAVRSPRGHRRVWRTVRVVAGVAWPIVLVGGLVGGGAVDTTTTTVVTLVCVGAVGVAVLVRLLRAAGGGEPSSGADATHGPVHPAAPVRLAAVGPLDDVDETRCDQL